MHMLSLLTHPDRSEGRCPFCTDWAAHGEGPQAVAGGRHGVKSALPLSPHPPRLPPRVPSTGSQARRGVSAQLLPGTHLCPVEARGPGSPCSEEPPALSRPPDLAVSPQSSRAPQRHPSDASSFSAFGLLSLSWRTRPPAPAQLLPSGCCSSGWGNASGQQRL